jgi:hypothetical protein
MSRELPRAYRIPIGYEETLETLLSEGNIDITQLEGRDRTNLGTLAKNTGLFEYEKKTVLRRIKGFRILSRTETELKIVEDN